MTAPVKIENGNIAPGDEARMHTDVGAFLQEQEAAGADPEILADIGYTAMEPAVASPAEEFSITDGDTKRMHRDIAEFLQEQADAGANPTILEDVGYRDIPEAGQHEEDPTLEERAEAAVLSGKLLITHEISPPKTGEAKKQTAIRKPAKRRTTTNNKLLAAKDRAIGDSKKPWPYGSMPD